MSGWSVDTLHSHLITLLAERSNEWDSRFQSQERALEIARESDGRIQAINMESIKERLRSMDHATATFETQITRVPTDVDKQVGQLRDLHQERFNSIDKQLADRDTALETRFAERDASIVVRFEERDTRSERESRDNKIAVDAAFAAAKEAVAEQNKSNGLAIQKSEAATTKQIDATSALIATTNKASDDKIDDIKATLASLQTTVSNLSTTIVGRRAYDRDERAQANWSVQTLLATAIGVLSLIVSIVVAIFLVTRK